MNNKKYNPFEDTYNFNTGSNNWVQRLGYNADFYNNPLGYNSSPTPRPYDNTTAYGADDDNEVISGFKVQTPRTTSLNNGFNVNKQQPSMGNMASFNLKGNNNASDFNANSSNWVQRLGHNDAFHANPLGYNSSPTPRPYKIASNGTSSNLFNQSNSVEKIPTNHQDMIFNRVFTRTIGEEGGYEDREDRIDTKTNMGIQQATLDRFKKRHPGLSHDFPNDVKDITYKQAQTIARKDYFDPYRIGEIKSNVLQETMFDSFFNHSPTAPALWAQRAINQNTDMQLDEDGVFGSKTINALNKLSDDEIVKVNNHIIQQRLNDYEQEIKNNPNPYYKNYTVGLPSRFERFKIK